MKDIIKFNSDTNELILLDQRRLPFEVSYKTLKNSNETAKAIKNMVVRGAPAIGITAAYGYYLGSIEKTLTDKGNLERHMSEVKEKLLKSRPTAVNLKWALNKMNDALNEVKSEKLKKIRTKLLETAKNINKSEIEANKKLGHYGAEEFKKIFSKKGPLNILTHCNAGALATGGWGTAVGVIRSAFNDGLVKEVFVDETRPRMQGARLTCFELKEENIPYRLITDGMAAHFMSRSEIDAVVVGADRIALNGDVANKIGTSMVAIAADYYNVPFYVAAPVSTFDFNTPTGKDIVIEEREAEEVLFINGTRISPDETKTTNPAFDITEKRLIKGYITEKGVIESTDELQ